MCTWVTQLSCCHVLFCLAVSEWETASVRVCVCVPADDDPGPRGCWGTRPHPDNREQCCQISCDITPGPQPAIRLSSLPKTALKNSLNTLLFYKHTTMDFRVQSRESFQKHKILYSIYSETWLRSNKALQETSLLSFKSYLYSPVLFMPWKPISLCCRTWRRWEAWWVCYPPAPHVGVVVLRGSAVPSHCMRRVVFGSPILECPLRFGRRLSLTWRVPAFLPEQPVPLKLTPETPWSVEVPSRHVVFLFIGW